MQIQAKSDSKPIISAQEILHIIAKNASPLDSIKRLLETAQNILNATGICYLLENDIPECVIVGESAAFQDTHALLAQLPETGAEASIHGDLYVIPLALKNGLRAGLWACLATDTPPVTHDSLQVVLDALVIASEQAHAQHQQQESDHLVQSLLKSITDPLVIMDDQHRIQLLNPAAAELFTTNSDEASEKQLQDVINSDALMALFGGKNQNLKEWDSANGQTFIPRTETVLDPNGKLAGWILVLRDITRFKKLNRNQSEFIRIVSHDLRSPLTSIQGFASMTPMAGSLNEKQQHFVEKILSGITQMSTLVDNIQDAGRYDPETGFYDVSRAHLDLGEMVNRIVENHLVPAEKQELQVSVNVGDDVPIINVDTHMLERAVTNLVDNAIKYTPNGGNVNVSVERHGEQVVIAVKDSGLGISAEHQKLLFQRHVRIPRQEHKRIKGTGLGLFIVRSVAQKHGGDAWVESVEGEGSTFKLMLPLEGENLISG